MSMKDQEIPEHLKPIFDMLKCAYPNELDTEEYFPLLGTLGEIMNQRGIANVVSVFAKKDYGEVYNDVLASQSSHIPAPEAIASVKERLIPCGYEKWLNEV
ncbi:MAG: DUF3349 domain-containing protein [Anaerolineae bacterium]